MTHLADILSNGLRNLLSPEERDSGTKKALGTIVASPVVADILMSDRVQAAVDILQSRVLEWTLGNDNVVMGLAGLAILLGLFRGAQPANRTTSPS